MVVTSHKRGVGRKIVQDFVSGMAPSEIDLRRKLPNGTSRDIISGWWLDDKIRVCDDLSEFDRIAY